MTAYYDKLINQLKELHSKRLISVDPNNINSQLDIVLRSFAFIADNIQNSLSLSYETMRKDIIQSLYPYVFKIIPSIAVIRPVMEFSAFGISMPEGNRVLVFYKDKKYIYSIRYSCTLYDVIFSNFMVLAYSDMSAYMLNAPQFFLSFNLRSNNFPLDECQQIEVMIYVEGSNVDILSIMNGSKNIFIIQNSQLINIGVLSLFDDFELLDASPSMPKHVSKSMSYFIMPTLFNVFKLKLDLSLVTGQEVMLYLSVKSVFNTKHLVFLPNPIVITNQFSHDSEHYNLKPNNKHLVYVDYDSKKDILIRTVNNVFCIDNLKQVRIIADAQGSGGDLDQEPHPFLVYKSCSNNDIYNYKLYVEIIVTDNVDVGEHQFFIDAECTNYVDEQLSFNQVVFPGQGAITAVKSIVSNTYTFLNTSLLHVYEHVFFLSGMNFLNVEDKTSALANLVQFLYKVCGRNHYLYDLIKHVSLSNNYDSAVFNGKYLANLSILSIEVVISTKYIDIISEALMRAISYLLYGLVGFDKRASIQFISEDRKNLLICYKYIQDNEEHIIY